MNGSSKIDGPELHNDDSNRIDNNDILSDNDDDDDSMIRGSADADIRNGSGGGFIGFLMDLAKDLWLSSGIVMNNRLNWLLVLGPIALLGSATEWLGDTACFAFSGLALIPCAERLSFVTEQVAEHTNGTIGALLNATFGNAPELLIASAALRKGFYRVVQLAMLGSMLTNLLFVFGISCLIGGFRWQVQELRITSGNVSVGMLLLSTAGSLLPATLVLGGQLKQSNVKEDSTSLTSSYTLEGDEVPSLEELQFCRINAFVMIIMYGCYLIFQLGTHKEEFDEEENIVQTADAHELHMSPHFTSLHRRQQKAKRNLFCIWLVRRAKCFFGRESNNRIVSEDGWMQSSEILSEERKGIGGGDVEMMYRDNNRLLGLIPSEHDRARHAAIGDGDGDSSSDEECLLPQNNASLRQDSSENYFDDYVNHQQDGTNKVPFDVQSNPDASGSGSKNKQKNGARPTLPLGLAEPLDRAQTVPITRSIDDESHHREAQMSFRVGILWLLIITLAVSAMSDILVDTIDGFAIRLHISEVFTSMVIVPFFSNVAEQVSAILFAYRNEMDLCVGVTVGSAIQVASFVLPGCVIIGWLVDRNMTLYFHAYETVCLFLAVVVIAAVLQGGTTNWLVGATCISVYMMIATGFWFHSLEDLSVDAETFGLNETRALFSAVY
eukprot:CAMPEP_0197173472 /NCGR_PEP_ID=MMETSP1423-20130617/389_1 /TAXON_ID=476441 /ORGANISM="Pseudo-nitzschia heimii, Strain UNC1101" /LENGTH=665 /DNA_ID=CAMNT_0042622293 /DNA_START=435 /DNA_END=2432 /DNA_ORIENTATION=-